MCYPSIYLPLSLGLARGGPNAAAEAIELNTNLNRVLRVYSEMERIAKK